jgi:hypothetical protein
MYSCLRGFKAFEAVGEAKRMLEDEDKMSFINKVLDEAKEKTKFMVAEKRGQARKSGEKKILEDSPSAVRPTFSIEPALSRSLWRCMS